MSNAANSNGARITDQVCQSHQTREIGHVRDAIVGERQHRQFGALRNLRRDRVHFVVVEPQFFELLQLSDFGRHFLHQILCHRQSLELREPRNRRRNGANLIVIEPNASERRDAEQRGRKHVQFVVFHPNLVQRRHLRHFVGKAAVRVNGVARQFEFFEMHKLRQRRRQ